MTNLKNGDELELKFEMSRPEVAALQDGAQLARRSIAAPVTRRLRSIYFDTPRQDLRAAGISLRLRRVAGHWIQTVKSETALRNGLSNPIESETVLVGRKPDPASISNKALRRRVKKIERRGELTPVFETDVRRTTYRLRDDEGGEAELAVDIGNVICDLRSDPLEEVELELKKGPASTLLTLACDVFADRSFRLGSRNKAARGYRLLSNDAVEPPLPGNGMPPLLEPQQSVEMAFAASADAAIAGILHNWQVVHDTHDPEGPHQLRVGFRRLRSVLSGFRPIIDGAALRALDERVRDAARVAGALRDADVLIDDICRPVVADGSRIAQGAAEALMRRLEARRVEIREQALATLHSSEFAPLQIELALFTKIAAWRHDGKPRRLRQPVAKLAATALDRSFRKVSRWGKRIDRLDVEERHAMRKALKTLRYQVEFFGGLFPGRRTIRFVGRLKALQDLFGYLNDVAMAEHLNRFTGSDATAETSRQEVADQILQFHADRADKAWKKAQRRWRELADAKPFWP